MGWLESEPLAEIPHRLDLARSTVRELRRLAPDDQRDIVIANLDRTVAEHEAELARRLDLTAAVIARTRAVV